jgi:LAO/AO transport system kinase
MHASMNDGMTLGILFPIKLDGTPPSIFFPFRLSALHYSLNQDVQLLVDQLRAGDSRALARAISAVENRSPGWSELLKALFPHTGRARILGLTGAPGAGKSTLVDHLARLYRKENLTVGIIAVDPTSPYTGGAILGDRIRMQEHFSDPGIYIRSMATRGSLGGLARTTADVATVLDASGRNLIMIETVGVGQDEIDIVRLAEITVVILVPGMGDDVQTIKAGIMEIADIFVINKSDREGAERVEREVRALQSLAVRSDNWTPPIVKTVATEATGIQELAGSIGEYESYLQKENLVLKRNIQNWQARLIEMLRDALLEKARQQFGDGNVDRYAAEVAEHKRDPYTLVEEIVSKIGKG